MQKILLYGELSPRVISRSRDKLGVSRVEIGVPWIETNSQDKGPSAPPAPGDLVLNSWRDNDKPGWWERVFSFEGALPNDPSVKTRAAPEIDFVPEREKIPIGAHPDIEYLIRKYGGQKEKGGYVTFPEKMPEKGQNAMNGEGSSSGKDDMPNPMWAQTSYIGALATLRISWISRGAIPNDVFARANEITINVPHAPTPYGHNWLKMLPAYKRRGNVLQVTEEYLLSGKGGWNPDIYKFNRSRR